jgi:hypothetical protein
LQGKLAFQRLPHESVEFADPDNGGSGCGEWYRQGGSHYREEAVFPALAEFGKFYMIHIPDPFLLWLAIERQAMPLPVYFCNYLILMKNIFDHVLT